MQVVVISIFGAKVKIGVGIVGETDNLVRE